MRKVYQILITAFFVILAVFGIWSAVDKDATISVVENRTLAEKPSVTITTLLDGTYQSDYETYYGDTFPLRETFMSLNRKLNGFYNYTTAEDDTVVITGVKMDAQEGGVSLDDYAAAINGPSSSTESEPVEQNPTTTTEPSDSDNVPDVTDETEQPPAEDEETPPELEYPEDYATTDSTIIFAGNQAMDIPTALYSTIGSYAEAVNNISNAMGEDVQTYCLVTPNSGQFYSPEDFHTGSHDQQAMIEALYEDLQDSVISVDAYNKLYLHADEYLFFRTDHHWTALGAYYAYVAFCESAGLEAVELDEFETGRYENFIGTFYSYTSGHPKSQVLLDNPDYVDYYLPIVETSARYYSDSTLTNGIPIDVVETGLSESYSYKYLCFISGDTPVLTIDTDVEDGGTCLVIKNSYGNAFIPFLTSHYSRIIAVDPREFNRDGKPSLDLTTFAAEQGVDDVIVIDYPFMINNSYYIAWLNRLVD